MIRMMIVDDEPIERIALHKIMAESSLDIEVVGEASNGREAIEAAARLQPDLITMDIKMPGINGLQAIEKIREANDSIKFIIVTAFDTFEFAQQAIRLGVYDYMLKPSRISVVLETIGKVANEIKNTQIERQKRSSEKIRLQKMMPMVEAEIVEQLLFDYVPSTYFSEMIDLLGFPSVKNGFVVNVVFTHAMAGGQPEELEELYSKLIQQIHDSSITCWVGKMSGKQVQLIVFTDGELSYRAQAIGLARNLIQALNRKSDYRLFIGVGGQCQDVREMRRSYHEALLASIDSSLPVHYCLYEDVPHADNQALGSLTIELEKSVLDEVRCGKWESAGEQIAKIIDVFEGVGQRIDMAQQRVFELLVNVTKLLQEMGIDVNKPYFRYQTTSYMQLKAETRYLIHQLVEVREAESDLLQTMKQYIRKYAHEDLSLERIAAIVNRNPFYVSKLFKEHFGMNYIDYLTEFRIETAKQLMQESDKSLKEITYEVGYHDPNYFSRVFKKLVGHSPTDYRKMLIRPATKK
ncbi:response regulator [Paenibacillus alba]|uniref:Response regulator n=1 Tax=Paenibacillus alba TaxID=1197127 RepID=A0ABU6G2B0_9BACL|nr:response regulator [Paenibacillus alba]MEC0228292.1 response regulator [Paenibacillus alba]